MPRYSGGFMENIIKYSRRHHNTQLTLLSASEAGIGVLNDMQEKLHSAEDELQRMQDDGGPPLNEEQTERVSAYFKAGQRIKNALRLKKSKSST